jgi:hypothetical protein
MNKLIIAIDFDGTIVDNIYPEIGKLKPMAKEIINKLYNDGHYIIIWTCRNNSHIEYDLLTDMKYFLEENDIKYHKINKNVDHIKSGDTPKIYADIYIDDRSLFYIDDWDIIYKELQRRFNI